MYSPQKILYSPENYEFPYTPYKIQQQLMDAVYGILTQKAIGIFESPTGTGKSLTLTCSVLRWIEDRARLERDELAEKISQMKLEVQRSTSSVEAVQDWVTANFVATEKKRELDELHRLEKLLRTYDEELREMRDRQQEKSSKRRKEVTQNMEIDEDPKLGITDLSDWDEPAADDDVKKYEEGKEEDRYRPIQVFFCSRTHSQLAQVVREIKRTPYGRRIRCISLASRQQLCINQEVKKLASVSLMNERCLDMAPKSKDCKKNTKSKCCPFRKSDLMEHLSETALLNIMDIEELAGEGETLGACPYYAAREAVKSAQLIMLTYQMLLHRRTRLQAGIDLRGAVVVVDEAHNLLDTIARLHSCELTWRQLQIVQQPLIAYKMRYLKKISTISLLSINQLIFIVKRLLKLLQPIATDTLKPNASSSRILRTYELTAEGEFYNINLKALLEFCERTRLAEKLQGFGESVEYRSGKKMEDTAESSATKQLLKQIEISQKTDSKTQIIVDNANETNARESSGDDSTISISSAFRSFLAFIESLTENSEDGRVVICTEAARGSGTANSSMYRYILLNPGEHFADIVQEARAIIIAGGTMQPTNELIEQLFRACPNRVQEHIYGHVVPINAVLPLVVAQGPTGRRMCFNYAERSNSDMLTEMGMIIQNICNVVPAGIVCFLPSYEYLDLVYKHLEKIGILDKISMKKYIFVETRAGAKASVSVETLLAEYSAAVHRPGRCGAVLFSVVGGKLSEGLNFADDLGRCVIVIGMPYPNRQSIELQERMRYLDNTFRLGAGNEYYENLCMKAVNQCIGRSVRHINDFACVLLVDERYCKESVQAKLPQWITRSLQMPKNFGAVQAATARFFKNMKMRK